MASTFRSRFAQRVSLRTLLWYLLVAAGVVVVTGNIALVAGLATAFLVTETRQVLKDAPGVDDRWVTVGLAIVLLAVSFVWLVAEFRQPAAVRTLWAPVAAILGSLWLLLDARVDFIYDQSHGSSDPADNLTPDVFLLRMLRVNRIADTLGSDQKTIPEIAAACDLTESQVRVAIEFTGDDGPIVRVDDKPAESTGGDAVTDSSEPPQYTLDTRQLGVSGVSRMAAGGLAKLLRRLARPLLGPA